MSAGGAPGAASDEPVAVRAGDELDEGALGAFLADTLGWAGPLEVRQFPGGYSNRTYLVRAGDEELVLRAPPPGVGGGSAHDMTREHRVLAALHPHFPLAPEPLFSCEDPAVLGAPFYGMRRVRGVILREQVPPGLDLDAAAMGRLCEDLVTRHAELHGLDPGELGLGELGDPVGYVGRQVGGWSERYRRARTEDAPDFEAVMAWLAEHEPPDSPRAALVHGDYKLDNVVLDPGEPTRIVAVLDWEMCTLGDPWLDLGASLAYWVQADDPPACRAYRTMPTDHPGAPTRAELVARYAAARGEAAPDFRFYRVFGLFRLAGIAQQIYARHARGQTSDPRFAGLIHAVRALEGTARREAALPRG